MSIKKRILFIHHGNARAGAFISLLGLLDGLDQSKFESIICSSENDAEVIQILESKGHITCGKRMQMFAHTSAGWYRPWRIDDVLELAQWFRDYPQARRNLQKLIADTTPDIVHFNSLTLAPYARIPHEMGVPVIVHVRERVEDGFFGMRKTWLRQQLIQNADKVICICKDNMERLNLPKINNTVIYNPVDLSKFDFGISQEEARRELEIPEGARAVLFAGGAVVAIKGLYDFLDAMAGLVRSYPDLYCLMPGVDIEGDLAPKPTLRKRVAQLMGRYVNRDRCYRKLKASGLSQCIRQSEFTYDMEKWLAACDVVCVPHIEPHFSRTVLEAGAMKKPVVAYAIGGVEEVVQHGETGLLVRLKDINGLQASIEKLLKDPDLGSKLGECGYRQAQRISSTEVYAHQIEALYYSLKNGGS